MPPTAENKLKLTESGASALRSWMARNSVSLVELGEAIPGGHPMAVSRWCKRQGLLTLEQLGHLVAYSYGELTAEMLVGRDRAPGVPSYPLRQRPPARVSVVSAPVRAAPADGGPGDGGGVPGAGRCVAVAVLSDADEGPPSIEELRRLGRKGLRRLEAVVDNDDSAATAAAEAAYRLVKNWIAAEELERQKEKVASVKEVDLLQKFDTLLYNARRQAEDAARAAAPAVAGAVPGAVPPEGQR